MRILAIDPSSNEVVNSTTGVVLLDNTQLVNYWIIPYGAENFKSWFKEIGKAIQYDVVVCEKFEVRENDHSRDNSVVQTIASIELCYPDVILQRNAGYKSDIPDDLLKKLGLWTFDKSHHQDVRAAARMGLFYAQRNDIEEVIIDIGKATIEGMAV